MSAPLAIDLFCGLGGWTEGLLAEGFDVIGFDVERHVYGEHRYPAQLVLQDVRTLHGRQFKDAALIVASSPCQKYSYMAMPWTKAKDLAKWYRDPAHPERLDELNDLFVQPARIQREASEAAGRYIPMIQENVRGAQPWVGRSRWSFGSYHLWGDVPALMPVVSGRGVMKDGVAHRANGETNFHGTKVKTMGAGWYPPDHPKHVPGMAFNTHAERATKNAGGSWFAQGHPQAIHGANPDGRKVGGDWFGSYAEQKAAGTISPGRLHGKGSSKRAAASAHIAKIPLALARHIAHVYRPVDR